MHSKSVVVAFVSISYHGGPTNTLTLRFDFTFIISEIMIINSLPVA